MSVIRLEKELQSYQDELAKQTKIVSKMRADGADPHDTKQQVCVSMSYLIAQ